MAETAVVSQEGLASSWCCIRGLVWPTPPLPTVSSANQHGEAEAICNRYEHHATVISSNCDFNEWPLCSPTR